MAGKRSYSETYSSSRSSTSSDSAHKKKKKKKKPSKRERSSSKSSDAPKDRKKKDAKNKQKGKLDSKDVGSDSDTRKGKQKDKVKDKDSSPKRKSADGSEKASREKVKDSSKEKAEKDKPITKEKEKDKVVDNEEVAQVVENGIKVASSELLEKAVATGDSSALVESGERSERMDDPDEPVEKKLRRDIASLQEMLDERVKQRQEAKDAAEAQDLDADIEILRGLVRERELELVKETARVKQLTITDEREHLKQVLLEREMQKQKEEDEKEVQKQRELEQKEKEEELEKERQVLAEQQRREMEVLEPHTLVPPDSDPPCELPIWCVIPSRRDIVYDVELVRLSAGSNALLKRVWFGKRSWVLFGRRFTGSKADIGLAAARASRNHAIVMRNWLGQVFLQDLGSPNGTFMDKQKLKPYSAVEWRIGSVIYFADPTPEVFELRLWKKS